MEWDIKWDFFKCSGQLIWLFNNVYRKKISLLNRLSARDWRFSSIANSAIEVLILPSL